MSKRNEKIIDRIIKAGETRALLAELRAQTSKPSIPSVPVVLGEDVGTFVGYAK